MFVILNTFKDMCYHILQVGTQARVLHIKHIIAKCANVLVIMSGELVYMLKFNTSLGTIWS